MSNDESTHFAIPGYGLFRRKDLVRAMPQTSLDYGVYMQPPSDLDDDFEFGLVRQTKATMKVVFDDGEGADRFELEDEINAVSIPAVANVELSDLLNLFDSKSKIPGEIRARVKNYAKNLRAHLEYLKKVEDVRESDAPNVDSLVEAIEKVKPEYDEEKQQARVDYITRHLNEVLESVKPAIPDEDSDSGEPHELFAVFDDMPNHELSARDMLIETFNGFLEGAIVRNVEDEEEMEDITESEDEGEDEGEDFEQDERLLTGDEVLTSVSRIQGSPTTLRNDPEAALKEAGMDAEESDEEAVEEEHDSEGEEE